MDLGMKIFIYIKHLSFIRLPIIYLNPFPFQARSKQEITNTTVVAGCVTGGVILLA
jgi:hypothetical protein